jgi:hypothetical protein
MATNDRSSRRSVPGDRGALRWLNRAVERAADSRFDGTYGQRPGRRPPRPATLASSQKRPQDRFRSGRLRVVQPRRATGAEPGARMGRAGRRARLRSRARRRRVPRRRTSPRRRRRVGRRLLGPLTPGATTGTARRETPARRRTSGGRWALGGDPGQGARDRVFVRDAVLGLFVPDQLPNRPARDPFPRRRESQEVPVARLLSSAPVAIRAPGQRIPPHLGEGAGRARDARRQRTTSVPCMNGWIVQW